MEDIKIIDLYFARSEQAIEETATKYGSYLGVVANNILHRLEDIEEVVNDVYLAAWNSIPPNRPNVLKHYLSRITRNLSFKRFEYLSAEKRCANTDIMLSELDDCIPDNRRGVEEIIEAKELGDHINQFLSTLDTRDCGLFFISVLLCNDYRSTCIEIFLFFPPSEIPVRKNTLHVEYLSHERRFSIMKNTDLCDAIQYVDDKYLDIANFSHKDINQDQNNNRPQVMKTYRVLLIAVAISLLALTACATNVLNIRSLITGTWKSYKAYHMLDQAMEDAGFKISVKEGFGNQYFFTEVFVNETSAMDSENQEAISYNEIIVIYSNDSGDNLILNAHPDLEDIPNTPSPVASSKTIGNVTINYYLDHYRYVPDDYELTDEDRIWEQQPGNYIAYGSEALEETSVAFLSWSAGGIYYSIMDSGTAESPEFLFSMAEVLINNAK